MIMTTERTTEEIELLRYISETPDLLSLLYDCGLMPEELERDDWNYARMLMIAEWRKTLTPLDQEKP